MENQKIIFALGALGLIYYAFSGSSESEYYVPNYGWIKESALPSYGYQKVNGIWYSQAQINQAALQAGVQAGTVVDPTSQVFNTIATILQTMQGLLPVVNAIVTAANRPQKIQEILNKYTVSTSAYYNASFPYNQTQLQGMTNDQLTSILQTGSL